MNIEKRLVADALTVVTTVRSRPLRVALLGFGTVGRAVARILVDRRELADRLRLTHVFNRHVARKRTSWVPDSVAWTEDVDDVLAAAPDVLVEAIGGVEPAGEWVRRALAQGAFVVTANKLLLAEHAPELLALAAASGGHIRFEAAVGGGVPLIHGIREGLAGDCLTRVSGILNGTCNYVLSRMDAAGMSMDVALDDARTRGYAEADPSADLDGHDAAAKLVVLAGIAFKRYVRMSDVPKSSLRPVSAADLAYAHRLGCAIRQISLAETCGDGLHAFVGPALVPHGSSFGRNDGADNVVTVTGRFGGTSSFSGPGAGGNATAVAVVSDLLALTDLRESDRAETWRAAMVMAPPPRPFYLRFVVRDRPGILECISGALARHGINLDAVLQDPGYPKHRLPFVVTVDPCEEAGLRQALDDVATAGFHVDPPLALPMLRS